MLWTTWRQGDTWTVVVYKIRWHFWKAARSVRKATCKLSCLTSPKPTEANRTPMTPTEKCHTARSKCSQKKHCTAFSGQGISLENNSHWPPKHFPNCFNLKKHSHPRLQTSKCSKIVSKCSHKDLPISNRPQVLLRGCFTNCSETISCSYSILTRLTQKPKMASRSGDCPNARPLQSNKSTPKTPSMPPSSHLTLFYWAKFTQCPSPKISETLSNAKKLQRLQKNSKWSLLCPPTKRLRKWLSKWTTRVNKMLKIQKNKWRKREKANFSKNSSKHWLS